MCMFHTQSAHTRAVSRAHHIDANPSTAFSPSRQSSKRSPRDTSARGDCVTILPPPVDQILARQVRGALTSTQAHLGGRGEGGGGQDKQERRTEDATIRPAAALGGAGRRRGASCAPRPASVSPSPQQSSLPSTDGALPHDRAHKPSLAMGPTAAAAQPCTRSPRPHGVANPHQRPLRSAASRPRRCPSRAGGT